MKITSIKTQVKNPDRLSVYVDEKYAFSLNYNQLLEQKIHAGLEVTEERLAELKRLSNFGKAFERALNYALLRLRSVREMRSYLRRKKVEDEDAEAILNKLAAYKYLDDHAFARSWVESRALTKSTSRRKLQAELQQKGVKSDIITDVLQHTESYDESRALHDLIVKKRRLKKYQDPQKLMQYLARQGFGFDDIKQALGDL